MKTLTACRRCAECEGEAHHWMEKFTDDDGKPIDPRFGCKHCEYTCEAVECSECDEFVPLDATNEQRVCPTCQEPQGAA